MPVSRLTELLDERGIDYRVIRHEPTYTASSTAQSAHIPGREVAKTVMVKLDGRLAMVVVPAPRKVNLGRLRRAVGASEAMLADEDEFGPVFPDCETGAMPPFGQLYNVELFADDALADDEEIAFNAGSHSELVQLTWNDYVWLAHPQMVALR
ncbi:MAG: YbaK/EbsC family protein [Gammaproteobacteria bacterium]|nr:YbaK/EbsC family protein [Gammaproteobacteria bacterium]NNM01830.1 YbaK/EbsC family protein [Gammaproteobacteria bacterium]